MSAGSLPDAIGRAVGFLANRQLPYGEMRVDRAGDRRLREPAFESSPYGTTYVLHSLSFADDPRIADVAARGRRFLAEEMEPPGLWRYCSSRNPKTLPPDLDDTACAALILRQVHDEVRLGLHLRVILANRGADGLFRTFLTDGGNNVDAVVNANVLCYLGEREETGAACEYLLDVVAHGREPTSSVYGVDDLSFYYVLSRAYDRGVLSLAPCRERVVSAIAGRRRPDGSFGDELATALAVATLCNLGGGDTDDLGGAASFLVSRQRSDGSWPRASFYVDFAGGFYGSDELTTAFAVEALARTSFSSAPRAPGRPTARRRGSRP
jgi:hypothetical protein